MTFEIVKNLILGAITDFGTYAIIVLSGIIVIGLAFLLFNWGWRKIYGGFGGFDFTK